jgi:hypothetical protein
MLSAILAETQKQHSERQSSWETKLGFLALWRNQLSDNNAHLRVCSGT